MGEEVADSKNNSSRQVGDFAHDWGRLGCHVFVWSSYVLAIGVGILAAYLVEQFTDLDVSVNEFPLVLAAVADMVATIVVWLSAIVMNNSSMYDPYWSVFSPVVIIYWYILGKDQGGVPTERAVLVFVSVWVWAIRLTSNWARDWPGLHHEDFRYGEIQRAITDKGLPKWVYWIAGSLGGIMVFPTIQVFMGTVPTYFALTKSENDGAWGFNALDVVATVVCVSAATIQYVADAQMRTFRRSKPPAGTCMESGLWRYSRHPNYYGELQFWLGLFLHGLATNAEKYWWTGLGFLQMVIMFVFASIPLMEKRSLKRRPNFKHTMETTSMLIPLPRWPEKKNGAQVSSTL